MTKKIAKPAAAKPAAAESANVHAAIAEAFGIKSKTHADKLAVLLAVDVSKYGEHDLKQHKAACLAEKNRADRNADFASCMSGDKFAATFVKFALSVDSVNRLQIYAQDKLLATLKAIAADCALSAVRAGNHSNMMTQRLIAALEKHEKLTIAEAPARMHDMSPNKSMGTYSAQASSSRQVLEVLRLIDFDANTRAFSLNEQGKEYKGILAS